MIQLTKKVFKKIFYLFSDLIWKSRCKLFKVQEKENNIRVDNRYK